MVSPKSNGKVAENKNSSETQPDFPPGIGTKVLSMMTAMTKLEDHFAELVKSPHLEILAKLKPLERAKMQILEAYTYNSLFTVKMKLSGDADVHSLESDTKMEMNRIKEVHKKLSEIEARERMQRIDQQAANRFIHHGLGKPMKRKTNVKEEEVDTEENNQRKKKKMSEKQKEIESSWQ